MSYPTTAVAAGVVSIAHTFVSTELSNGTTFKISNLGSPLPVGALFFGMEVSASTFTHSGGMTSLFLTVGNNTNLNAWINSALNYDLIANPEAFLVAPGSLGTATSYQIGGTQQVVRFDSYGAPLSSLTGGGVTITFYYTV